MMATTVTGTRITLSFYTDYQLGYQLGGAEISMGCDSNFDSKPLCLSLWYFPIFSLCLSCPFLYSYTEAPLDLPDFMSDFMFSFVFFSSPPPGSQGGNSSDLYGPVTLSKLEVSLMCCFGLSFPPLWLANVLLGNIIVYLCFFILLNKIDTLLLENNLCTSCL